MQKAQSSRYRFGNVQLDVAGRRVEVGGSPCPLEPKSFELLRFLVENRGRAVSKEEIVAAVWPGTFVTDNSLTRAMTKIRKALADDSREPRYIQTIPTVGYRFTADCQADEPEAPRLTFAAESTSLAVLPVINRTGDSEIDYLAEGFTDDTIRLLSEIPQLKIIARSSAYRFRSAGEDALAFARKLGVRAVLTGELKRVGNRLAFDMELTDVAEEAIIVSRQYWPTVSGWMDVQSEMALDVVRGLHLEIDREHSARLGARPSTSPEAYQRFLCAEFLARRVSPLSLRQALETFEEALRLDDRFTLAWGEYAQTQVMLGLYFEDPNIRMPAARQAAERALRMDGSLQMGHATLGIVHLVYDWDFAAAERELAWAAVCDCAASSFSCVSHLLEQSGRGLDAEGQIRHALAYDPQNATLVAELGCNNYYRRRYEQAIDYFRTAGQMDAQTPMSYWGLGRSLGQMGRYEEALAELREFKARSGFEPPLLSAEIGYVLGAMGRKAEALEIARQLEEASALGFVNPYFSSIVYLGMGDLDRAFEWLEKAYRERSGFVVTIPTEPKWRGLHGDPRFQSIVSRTGLFAR